MTDTDSAKIAEKIDALAGRITRLESTLVRFVAAWGEVAAGVSLGVQQAGSMIGRIAAAVAPTPSSAPSGAQQED